MELLNKIVDHSFSNPIGAVIIFVIVVGGIVAIIEAVRRK